MIYVINHCHCPNVAWGDNGHGEPPNRSTVILLLTLIISNIMYVLILNIYYDMFYYTLYFILNLFNIQVF
jgi:hypothetical protein